LQGADALAAALGALVVVPDFFRGSYMVGDVSPPSLLFPIISEIKIEMEGGKREIHG
jgi:hypothetical protein